MFGLNDFYNEILNEAKSPEEIKKILEYQFVQGKGVPQEILDAVFNLDPTKKKSYTRWVLMQWDKYSEQIRQSISDGSLARMFKMFKEKSRDKMGLDLMSIESFPKAMEYLPDVDPILEKEGDPNAPENQFDIMFESPEWVVAVPHTYEASEKLGEGCKWCTAGYFGDGRGYYKRYTAAGPLWINFDKRKGEQSITNHKIYPYTRYQFLFEWQNWRGELMDSHDDRINFSDLDMPEDVIEFYRGQNEQYAEIIESGPRENMTWEEYMERRDEMTRTVIALNSIDRYLVLLPEQNDDYDLDVHWQLYDESDTSDSPFYNLYFADEDCTVEHFFNNSRNDPQAAILLDEDNRQVLVYYDIEITNRSSDYGSWVFSRDFRRFNCDDCIFIIDDYNDKMFFMNTSRVTSFLCGAAEDVMDYRFAKNIEKIAINDTIERFINQNQVYGFEGDFFELIYSNGTHGLLYVSYDMNDIELLVQCDRPTEGNEFLSAYCDDNGTMHVRGERWDYNVGDTSSNYKILDPEESDERFILVKTNGHNSLFNVYDTASRKMVFDEDMLHIQIHSSPNIDYASVNSGTKYNDNNFFYDLTNGRKVCDYITATRMGWVYDIWNVETKDNKRVILSFIDDTKIFGPFIAVGYLNDTYVGVKKAPMALNIINTRSGKEMLPQDMEVLATADKKESMNYIIGESGGKRNIFNFKTGEVVLQNIPRDTRPIFIRKDDEHVIWAVKTNDGKYRLMYDDNDILRTGFSKFLGVYSNDFCMIEDNNTFYCVKIYGPNGVDFLPTNKGVNLDNIEFLGTSSGRTSIRFAYKNFIVHYFPRKNSNESLEITPNNATDEVRNEIISIFYPQLAQIKESFKLNYKKIIDRKNEDY